MFALVQVVEGRPATWWIAASLPELRDQLKDAGETDAALELALIAHRDVKPPSSLQLRTGHWLLTTGPSSSEALPTNAS